MATIAPPTFQERLQPSTRPPAADAGSDIASASADTFASLVDQLGQAVSTGPAALAPAAALPVTPGLPLAAIPPAGPVAAPPLTTLVAPTGGPIAAAPLDPRDAAKAETDDDRAPETPPRDVALAAEPAPLLQPALPPPPVPFVTPPLTMTAGTPLSAPTSPASTSPEPIDNGVAPVNAGSTTIAAKGDLTAKSASPDPAPAGEREAVEPTRDGPALNPTTANGTPVPSAKPEEKPATSTSPPLAIVSPSPAIQSPNPTLAAIANPPPALTQTPAPAAPGPRRGADQPTQTRAEATQSAASKSAMAEPASLVPIAAAAPTESSPIAPPIPLALSPAPASAAATVSRPAETAPPPSPAAQVATALVEPVQVMLATPSSVSPAQPHVTTIQITPVELGRIDIRIERPSDGPAKIELVAERPETLSRLVHDQSALHQALDQAGLTASNRTIEFSLAPAPPAVTASNLLNNGATSGDGSGGSASQRHGGRYPNQGPATDEPGPSSSTPLRSLRSGIDITA